MTKTKSERPEKLARPVSSRPAKVDAQQVPIDSVIPHPKNARKGDLEAIKESIRLNGFYGSLVVQKSTNHILVHNHAWKAAKALGFQFVPVIFHDCDDEAAERIVLVDNRTSDLASYDEARLVAALQGLTATERGLAGTGFDRMDLDSLEAALKPKPPPEEFPAFDADSVGSKLVHTCPKCKYKFS